MARSYHDLWGQTGNNEYAEQAIQWYDKRKVLSGYYDENQNQATCCFIPIPQKKLEPN